MMARAAGLAVVAVALASCVLLASVRYELRPRRARLDPASTGLPVEAVVIPSSSGASLAGWYLPGAGRGAVLLLHGAKSNRLILVERMRFLRDAGYSTLAIDFQAHGESTGDRITLGQLESLDARSALGWLRTRLPGEPVAVLGISMGGSAALIGQPIAADAVIVESVSPDLAGAVSNRLAVKFGPLGRVFTPFVLGAMRIAGGIDAAKLRPIDGIGRLQKPIFVMTGAEDQKTTVAEVRELFAAANPPKRYWETPGAQHWDLAWAGGEAYRERLLDFLASTLRSPPG
ncbi:MAG TPA: alpha/beta fold hydrolase [Roseiarcus sp.]